MCVVRFVLILIRWNARAMNKVPPRSLFDESSDEEEEQVDDVAALQAEVKRQRERINELELLLFHANSKLAIFERSSKSGRRPSSEHWTNLAKEDKEKSRQRKVVNAKFISQFFSINYKIGTGTQVDFVIFTFTSK